MAEEPIRKEDIIDVSGTQESINELIKTLENLSQVMRKDLKESADILEKSLQGVNAATKEGQERIKLAATESENLAAQQREMSKIDKETIQLKARLGSLNSNEANEVAKLKVAIEGKNRSMKDAARLDDSAEGSINKMRARLKELTAEYNKLSPAIRDKAAPAIKKLTEELKKSEGAIGNNTRNVGNYSSAILGAVKGLFSFSAITGLAMAAVNKLKEAFAATTEGMNLLNIVTATTKQLFYDLATTGKVNYDNLKNAAEATKVLNDIRSGDREDMVEFARLEREITKLEFEAANKTKSHADQADALNKAIKKQNELSDKRIADAWEELQAVDKLLSKQPRNEELLNRQAALKTKIIQLDDQRFSSMRRNEQRATQLEVEEANRIQKQYDDLMKAADDEIALEEDKEKKKKDIRDKYARKVYDQSVIAERENQEFIDNYLKEDKDKKDKEWEEGVKAGKALYDQVQKQTDEEVKVIEDGNDKKAKSDQEYEDLKRQRLGESFQRIGDSLNALSSLYEANKQRELSAAGDNAAAREAIERKYAKKQQTLAIGQALVNGAIAITEIWKKWAAFPVLAAIFTGLTTASVAMQIAVIKAQKFARGGAGILEGPSHAGGGINVGIGEAEGGEHIAITSRAMTSKYGGRMLDAVADSINQGKFFEIWANVNKEMGVGDPYTKKMYELMQKTPTTYIDSYGNTHKEYPDGRNYIIRRFSKN